MFRDSMSSEDSPRAESGDLSIIREITEHTNILANLREETLGNLTVSMIYM